MPVRQFIKEKDLLSCINDYIDVFNRPLWNDEWTDNEAGDFLLDYINHPSFLGFVCEDNDIPLGFIMGSTYKWWDCNHYYLNKMFVTPNKQRSGIGRFLISEVKKILKENGYGSIILLTMRNTPAETFYINNGFLENEDMKQLIYNF